MEVFLRAKIWLPLLYVIVAALFLFGLSGAGHGRGAEGFFYISLPLGAVSLLVERHFSSVELPVLVCFLGGLIQYVAIGYFLDRLVKSAARHR